MLLISSILAVVLFVIGYLIGAILPGGGEVDEADFIGFYEVDASFSTAFLLVLAMLAGSWALVWFFSELRGRLPDRILSRTGFAAAMIGAAGLATGAVISSCSSWLRGCYGLTNCPTCERTRYCCQLRGVRAYVTPVSPSLTVDRSLRPSRTYADRQM